MVPPLSIPLLPKLLRRLAAEGGRRDTILCFPFTGITTEISSSTGKKEQGATNPLWLLSHLVFFYHSEAEIHLNTGSLPSRIARLLAGDQKQPLGCRIWLLQERLQRYRLLAPVWEKERHTPEQKHTFRPWSNLFLQGQLNTQNIAVMFLVSISEPTGAHPEWEHPL